MYRLSVIITFLACLLLNVLLQAQERALEQINYLPNEFSLFIDSISTKTTYLEIPDFSFSEPPTYITKFNAIEDIQMLQYILDNGYSGRYFWEQKGIDFKMLYSDLLEFVNSNTDSISVKEFENILLQRFSNLNDGHSKIIGFKTTEFAKSKHAYFSEIVVEKRGSEYTVIQSLQNSIEVGVKYLDSLKYLFPTISPTNKEHFLIGILSFEDVKSLNLNFAGKAKSMDLHRCRIYNARNTEQIFESEKKDNINYIRISKLGDNSQGYLKKFSDYGKIAKNEKTIVYNLMNIDGGDAIYPRLFTENLNTNAKGFDYMATLHSPAVNQVYMPGKNIWLKDRLPIEWLQEGVDLTKLPEEVAQIIKSIINENSAMKKQPIKHWEIVKNNIPEDGTFKGKFYTIINNRVGSAAINATALTKSIPNNFLIGENTSGGYTFGEVVYYNLIHSKIKLKLPIKIVIHKDFNYEQGFLPDYWLDSEEPEMEITKWINNPNSYMFKY